MSTKKMSIGARPTSAAPLPPEADNWVSGRPTSATRPESAPPQPLAASLSSIKRITFEVPPEVHQRLKTKCAASQMTIKDYVYALIAKDLAT